MKKTNIIFLSLFVIFLLILPFLCADKVVKFNDLKKVVEPFIDKKVLKLQDKNDIYKEYKLNSSYYESFISYNSISYMEVEEITIFKEEDKTKQEYILDKIKNHIDTKIKTFEGYGEKQVKMLNNAYIDIRGDYIFCIVLKDIQEIKEKISKLF